MGEVLVAASSLGYRLDKDGDHNEPASPVLQTLERIHDMAFQLNKVQCELLSFQRYAETADITDPSRLAERVAKLGALCSHLEKVIENKAALLSHLQCPFVVGDFIVVEAKHQRELHDLFFKMVGDIAAVEGSLESICWAKQFSLDDGVLAHKLNAMSSFMAKCQRFYEALSSIRQAVEQMYLLKFPRPIPLENCVVGHQK